MKVNNGVTANEIVQRVYTIKTLPLTLGMTYKNVHVYRNKVACEIACSIKSLLVNAVFDPHSQTLSAQTTNIF